MTPRRSRAGVRPLLTVPLTAALLLLFLLLVAACRAEEPAGSGVTLLDGKRITVSGPTVVSALPIDGQGNVEAAQARNQIPSLKSVALQYPGVRVLITDSDGDTSADALRNFAANWAIPPGLVVAADSAPAGPEKYTDGRLHTQLIDADGSVAAAWPDRAAPTQAIVAALRKATASPSTLSTPSTPSTSAP